LSTVHPYRQFVARGASDRPSEQTGGRGELWQPAGKHIAASRAAKRKAHITFSTVLSAVIAVVAAAIFVYADAVAVAGRRGPAGGGGQ
jgi:hypothetical protein